MEAPNVEPNTNIYLKLWFRAFDYKIDFKLKFIA
jgi:hypothetical protein